MYFLTSIDSRAAIKGSRDPLGLQPIWTLLGRRVVGNLTTVTADLRNFTTLLLGLHVAEEAVSGGAVEEEGRVEAYLRLEALMVYSRVSQDMSIQGPLGITRARRRLREGGKTVEVSARSRHQLLSKQRLYGTWGLYTVAARNSGLVEPGGHVLTPAAARFVEEAYLGRLPEGALRLMRSATRGDRRFSPSGRNADTARALAGLLNAAPTARERAFYERHLLEAAPADSTGGRQARLWAQVRRLEGAGFGYGRLLEVAGGAEGGLARRLGDIAAVEPLLAAADALFGHVLQHHGQRVEDVADAVEARWGEGLAGVDAGAVEGLERDLARAGDAESAARFVALAGHLAGGRWAEAARVTVAQNAAVMRARGGAPWVDAGAALKVRLRPEPSPLPSARAMAAPWRHTYFLNALEALGRQVYAPEVSP